MGRTIIDLTGQTFGRWTVVGFDHQRGEPPNRRTLWLCECKCGTRKTVETGSLKIGNSTSCGCWNREVFKHRTHGRSNSTEYNIWKGMRQRCRDPKAINYAKYGGRGITVCERWQNSFENFFADMGPRPPGLTLDRRKNNLGYSKANCKWTTYTQNNRNTRRNVRLTFNGETLTVPEWAERLGITPQIINSRLRRGWSSDDALNLPLVEAKAINFNGQTRTLREWSYATGIAYDTLKCRLARGWPMQRVISESVHSNHGRN